MHTDRRRLAETRVLPQAASPTSQAEIAEIIGCFNPGPFLLFFFCFVCLFLTRQFREMAFNETESVQRLAGFRDL